MHLRLTVIGDPRRALGDGANHVFTEKGGTLGRNAGCDWVLADPTNTISSRHAIVNFNGRGFDVTDNSTNGIYINTTDAPLGRGNTAPLSNGDILYIGDLVFRTEIVQEERDNRVRLGLGSQEGWTSARSAPNGPIPARPGSTDFGTAVPAGLDPLAGFGIARPAPTAVASAPLAASRDPLAALDAQPADENLLVPSAPRIPVGPGPAAAPPIGDFLSSSPSRPPAPPSAAPTILPAPLGRELSIADQVRAAFEGLGAATTAVPLPLPPSLSPAPAPMAALRTPLPPIPAALPLALPPIESPVTPRPNGGAAGQIPDDFFAQLSGLPGLPPPPQPSLPAAEPRQPAPLSPPPLSPPLPKQTATTVLPANFSADLVKLGRETSSPGGPATPTLDPIAVLRRRGEGRIEAPPAPPSTPPAAPPFVPAPPASPPLPAAALPSGGAGDELAAFWSALGIDPAAIEPARRKEVLELLGRTLQQTIEGLIQVLSARKMVKEEFRMEQTRLGPVENNPLKFYRTGAEAVQRTVIDRAPGFLPIDQAARLGFRDIKAHEVASMIAMQAAIKQLFLRIGPPAIEHGAGTGLLGRKPDKTKLWDQFVELHRRFADTLDVTASEAISTEFARAYHEQIDQMSGESQ